MLDSNCDELRTHFENLDIIVSICNLMVGVMGSRNRDPGYLRSVYYSPLNEFLAQPSIASQIDSKNHPRDETQDSSLTFAPM